MGNKDERKHVRYQVQWSVEVTTADWSEVLSLTTTSVGRGGIFVCSSQPAEIGAEVQILLSLPDGNRVDFSGEVVRIVAPDNPSGHPAGFALSLQG